MYIGGNQMLKRKIFLLVLITFTLVLAGCNSQTEGSETAKPTITFADAGWDSIKLHNEIAGIIIREGLGYETDVMPGSEMSSLQGLRNGDIDVYMEIWTGNFMDQYTTALDSGDIIETNLNFNDTNEGLYVPTYVIKGDEERGIEPMAPDLETVQDLEKYWALFKDPEDPDKGRIYGSIPGWAADLALHTKFENYGLDEKFTYFQPGSGAALASSLTKAIDEGEAWVGYYWEPTWIAGKYDLTLLKDNPYNKEDWENGYLTEFPSQELTVAVTKDLTENAPDVVSLLESYETSSEIVSKSLAYMQDNEASIEETAQWFLVEYEDLWKSWVTEETAQKVKNSLQ